MLRCRVHCPSFGHRECGPEDASTASLAAFKRRSLSCTCMGGRRAACASSCDCCPAACVLSVRDHSFQRNRSASTQQAAARPRSRCSCRRPAVPSALLRRRSADVRGFPPQLLRHCMRGLRRNPLRCGHAMRAFLQDRLPYYGSAACNASYCLAVQPARRTPSRRTCCRHRSCISLVRSCLQQLCGSEMAREVSC